MLWTNVKLQSDVRPQSTGTLPFSVFQGNLCCIMGFLSVLIDLLEDVPTSGGYSFVFVLWREGFEENETKLLIGRSKAVLCTSPMSR